MPLCLRTFFLAVLCVIQTSGLSVATLSDVPTFYSRWQENNPRQSGNSWLYGRATTNPLPSLPYPPNPTLPYHPTHNPTPIYYNEILIELGFAFPNSSIYLLYDISLLRVFPPDGGLGVAVRDLCPICTNFKSYRSPKQHLLKP